MSNPHQQQPQHFAFGWNANTGRPNSNTHHPQYEQQGTAFPQHESSTGLKRSRDNESPTDHSMQQSFKRLKVMGDNDHHGGSFTNISNNNTVGHPLQSVSVDESSLADESSASPADGSHFPQHSAFIFQQQGHHSHNYHAQQGGNHKRQRLHGISAFAAAPKSQPSGQRPFESTDRSSVDYQPMNSLLGSLHRTRRRQDQGTGQEAVAVPSRGMSLPQQQQNRYQQQQRQHLQNQQHQQQHHHQPNADGSYTRPAKKKNLSLRVSSNLL